MTVRWFFPGTPVSSTNKTDRYDITEILFKGVLNTITLSIAPFNHNNIFEALRISIIDVSHKPCQCVPEQLTTECMIP